MLLVAYHFSALSSPSRAFLPVFLHVTHYQLIKEKQKRQLEKGQDQLHCTLHCKYPVVP